MRFELEVRVPVEEIGEFSVWKAPLLGRVSLQIIFRGELWHDVDDIVDSNYLIYVLRYFDLDL